MDTIMGHEGVSINATITKGRATTKVVGGQTQTSQAVSICGIPAGAPTPVHVVLSGQMTAGLTATNATLPGPDGAYLQGAQWLVNLVPSNGCVTLVLNFSNPNGTGQPTYGLMVQNNTGYSEAVASIQAFRALTSSQQDHVMAFLRAQLLGGKVGEGSGLVPPPAVK